MSGTSSRTIRSALLAGAAVAALGVAACQPTTVPPPSAGARPTAGAHPTATVPPGTGTGIGGAVGSAGHKPPVATKPTARPTATAKPSPTPTATTAPPAGGSTGAGTLDSAYPIPAGAVFVSPSGNDAAAGTRGAPLRTLARALAKAPAGATVVLRAGTYRESIASVTKRVTIQPYPHEQAWLSGSDVVTGWARYGSGWRSTTFRGSLCQSCYNPQAVSTAHPLAGKPNQVFVNGRALTQVAGAGTLGAGTFYRASDGSFVVGSNPAGSTVEISSRWKAMQLNDNAGGSVIRGIGFKQYAPVWDESQLAAVIVNTSNVTVTHDVFTQIAGTALAVTRPGAQVTADTVSGNGYRGLVANRADGLVLSGDRFDGNNTAHFNTGSCGSYCTVAGAKVTHTRGLTVTGSSFSGNDGAGFWCDLGCINGTITGNTVSGNSGNGLFYEVSANGTISRNAISGNGRGLKVSGSSTVAVSGNTFRSNGIDLGVYDDPRSPSSDSFSAQNGLSWNTSRVAVTGNTFASLTGSGTLLETNRTNQVAATGMFSAFDGNAFQPVSAGRVVWCPSSCVTYPSAAAFQAAVHLG